MPSTESTFDIGTLRDGSWRCACNRSPVWRTVAKEGPTKGERFLRCAPPPGKWDTQCSFFLWEAHKDDAETTMRQQNAPIVTIPGLTPLAPRTPSPAARSQTSSTLTSTTGTLTPGPSPTPRTTSTLPKPANAASSTLPKPANAASAASSLSFFGTQTSSQSSSLFGSQPFGQNNNLFSTLSNPLPSSSFGSQAPQPAEPFKAPSITTPSGTLFSSQATAKPSPLASTQPSAQPSGLFGAQPSGLFGPQPSAQSTTSPASQAKVQHSAQSRPRNLGLPTPEKTPHKPSVALEEDSSEVLNQIISRLDADGVPLKPSTEEYLGHVLREEIAIYEAKLRAKDVTIARLMQQIDRLSVKGY